MHVLGKKFKIINISLSATRSIVNLDYGGAGITYVIEACLQISHYAWRSGGKIKIVLHATPLYLFYLLMSRNLLIINKINTVKSHKFKFY